jgi:hypothetical protein
MCTSTCTHTPLEAITTIPIRTRTWKGRTVITTLIEREASMKLRSIVGFGVALGLLAGACGGDNSDMATELEGLWVDACANTSSGPPGTVSSRQSIGFAASTYQYELDYYSAASCGGVVLLQLVESGTIVLGDSETTPAGSKDVDFTQHAATATPHAGEAATLDAASTCTLGGSPVTFTDGTTVSIAGAICGGGADAQTSNDAHILGVYVVDTSVSPNTLALGSAAGNEVLGAVAPAARPTSLGSARYVKQ